MERLTQKEHERVLEALVKLVKKQAKEQRKEERQDKHKHLNDKGNRKAQEEVEESCTRLRSRCRCGFKRAAVALKKKNKQTQEWESMCFTPQIPLNLSDELCEEIVGFLHQLAMACVWAKRASTTLFFLIPKNITSERPIAFLPTPHKKPFFDQNCCSKWPNGHTSHATLVCSHASQLWEGPGHAPLRRATAAEPRARRLRRPRRSCRLLEREQLASTPWCLQ